MSTDTSSGEDEENIASRPQSKHVGHSSTPKSVSKRRDERAAEKGGLSEPLPRCKVIVEERNKPRHREVDIDIDSEGSNWSREGDVAGNRRASTSTAHHLHSSSAEKKETRAPPQKAVPTLHVLKRPLTSISDEVYKEAEQKGTVAKKHCHMCRSPRWSVLCTGVIQRGANKVERCTKGICDRCLAK